MGFPGDDNLHGHGGVGENFLQAREVAEDQGCSFVRSEAAGEADGQHGRVEQFAGKRSTTGGGALRVEALATARFGRTTPPCGACGGDVLPTIHLAGMSAVWRQNFRDRCGLRAVVGLEVLIVDGGKVAVDPGGEVHAVGDGGDGDFLTRQAGP